METIMTKNKVIGQIRSGSRMITVICLIASLFNLLMTAAPFIGVVEYGSDPASRSSMLRNVSGSAISVIIMLCAAAVFWRISRSGAPFERVNVRLVRIIGVLLVADAVLPTLAMLLVNSGMGSAFLMAPLVSPAMLEGVLFLFIAQIMHYGALLQQESDETL